MKKDTFSLQDMERCFNEARTPHPSSPFIHFKYDSFPDFMAAVHPPQPDDRVPGVRADDVLVCIRDIEGTYKNEELTVIRLMDDYSAFIRSAKSQLWVSLIPSHPNTSYPYVWNYFHLKQPAPQPELKVNTELWCIASYPYAQLTIGKKYVVYQGYGSQYLNVETDNKSSFAVCRTDGLHPFNFNWKSVFSLTPPAAQPPAKEEWVPTYGETVECWGRDKWYTATYACKHPLLPLTHLAISLYQVYQPQTIRKPAPPKTAPTDAQLQVIRENWDTLMATLPACIEEMVNGATQQNLLRLIDKLKNA